MSKRINKPTSEHTKATAARKPKLVAKPPLGGRYSRRGDRPTAAPSAGTRSKPPAGRQ